MPRQNVVFAIVAPLLLMAIIAAIVIAIGEMLLGFHHYGNELYHVGQYLTAAENHYAGELAALWPVGAALVLATAFLIGGAVASRLAPQPEHH
jgi:hypothetical protein